MKKIRLNKKKIYIAIFLCFVLGQFVGTYAIKQIFLNYTLKDIDPLACNIADEIAEGKPLLKENTNYILRAYDIYGDELIYMDEKNQPLYNVKNDVFDEALKDYIPKVLTQKEFAIIRKIKGLPGNSIIVGTPIIQDKTVIGVVFLLEPTSEFYAVLNGFYWVFGLTLLFGTLVISFFLSSYLKEVKRLEKTRRDYIANVSHELKSPISSIRALTETLADGMIQEKEKTDSYYRIILSECARLQRLIYNILELSKMQNVQNEIEKQKLDTNELITFVDDKYSVLAQELGITFEITQKARELPDTFSNRDKIIQLINIILDNAMKCVKEDGNIILDAQIHTKYITILISDNGIGISEDNIPYIFERFYKIDKSHNGKGSGLGLAIAKEIVNNLGEKIYVTSKLREGSTFRFTIKRI